MEPPNEQPEPEQEPEPEPERQSGGAGEHPANENTIQQKIEHSSVSARVPSSVATGVFSNGAIVLNGRTEFVLDFLQTINAPKQVVARLVLAPAVVQGLITALRENLSRFENRFGPIQQLATEQPNKPISFRDLYDELKIADPVLTGTYANSVRISHSASEFCFDFVTVFFPISAVSSRVYLSAPQARRLCDLLARSMEQFNRQLGSPKPLPNPPAGEEPESTPET